MTAWITSPSSRRPTSTGTRSGCGAGDPDQARTVLTLWAEDAYGGRITTTDDVASAALNTWDLNPQTGPFFVEGAEPGDTLAVHLVDLTPAQLGRVDADPVLRRPDQRPRQPDAAGIAARAHPDLRIRLSAKDIGVHRPTQ